jgi:hypothetical protein
MNTYENSLKNWQEATSDDDLGAVLATTLNEIINEHASRLDMHLKAVSAFDNRQYSSVFEAASQTACEGFSPDQQVTFNVIRSAVATLSSKVGKNKILPRIATTNARWKKRKQSARVEKYVRGLFKQLNVNKHMELALINCILSGDGFVKVCNDGNDISIERVLPDEVFVDYIDAYNGDPQAMYQIRIMNIRKVCSMCPEMEDELMSLQAGNHHLLTLESVTSTGRRSRDDQVVVIEAWALGYGSTPGRHVVTCGSIVLMDEEWDRDYFPIIRMQYNQPERGYYSQGIYQDVAPLQAELSFTFKRIADTQKLGSAFKVFVQRGSVPASRVTNAIGECIELDNMNDIKVFAPPALSGEQFAYVSQLKALTYEASGVSSLSAASKLPTGIDGASGKALREYTDIETERFALLAQEWERAHERLATVLIKEIAKNGDFFVKSFSRTSPLETIKFSDLKLDIDDINVSVYPASSLPSRPEARFKAVQEWIEAGFIGKEAAMELLDSPDLDAFAEIENAPKTAVDTIIDDAIENQIKRNVEPFFDLQYLIEQATLFYNFVYGEAEEINSNKTQTTLDILRELIEDASEMLKSLQPQPEGGPMEAPMGLPAPAPASGTMAGIATAEGMPVPEGAALPPMPPEALANLGGMV